MLQWSPADKPVVKSLGGLAPEAEDMFLLRKYAILSRF